MSQPELEITHCEDGLLMAVVGPVCVALWQTKPIPRLFQIQKTRLAAAVARDPGRVAFLCAVTALSAPPDEAERSGAAAMITEHGRDLAAVAAVIEGTGFRAAITRTVLSGITFVVRTPSPIRLFESVALATPWLAKQLTHTSFANLPQQFDAAREKLNAVTTSFVAPRAQNAQP